MDWLVDHVPNQVDVLLARHVALDATLEQPVLRGPVVAEEPLVDLPSAVVLLADVQTSMWQ